jgi:uncharacterized protein with HEPN domain
VSSREWRLRIQDILSSIISIQERIDHLDESDFAADETLIKAVCFDFIIIGEATRHIPSTIRSRYCEIPWQFMASMRNVMAHEYFQIDLERVWRTIHDDLPSLVPQLQNLLDRESGNQS